MNAAVPRPRSTGTILSDIRAISPGALVTAYLAATTVLLALGGQLLTRGAAIHVVALGGMAAATWARGVPRWLRSFAPLLMTLFLYTELPLLISATGPRSDFDVVIRQLEERVFGGQLSLTLAARIPSPLLSELLHASYLSYYAIIFVPPLLLYLGKRYEDCDHAIRAVMLTFVVCFVCFLALPVAGPRYFDTPLGAYDYPVRRLTLWLLDAGSSRGTAFPSSHVAVAVVQSVLAVRLFGRWGWIVAALSLGLTIGAVYGGFHYAIDVLAGAALGVALAFLAMAGRGPGQANATAPT